MEQFIHSLTIPENYVQLFLVVLFSLVIGLSQRKLQLKSGESDTFFGSDRTFTLIGMLGYILYIIDPVSKIFWGCGGAGLLFLLSFNYYFKLRQLHLYGITSIIIAILTYCIPALLMTQPIEFSLLVLVIVLLLSEMKETFISFATRMNNDEFITLAKFIIIAGIILPILPDERIFAGINLTPRNVWMTTVIISGMSYASYLLQKFVFRNSGLLVSGILGGLYSSTATTVVLSRKSKKAPAYLSNRYVGSIVIATAMMFVRIVILLIILNTYLFVQLWFYFLIMFIVSMTVGLFVYYYKKPTADQLKEIPNIQDDKNPLEFKVALIFALLFVLFTVVTHYTIQEFGATGLKILSFVVGLTDITPFITTLFQGGYAVPAMAIASAIFGATFSNDIVKMGYALVLGPKYNRKTLLIAFSVITVVNLLILLLL